MFAPISQYFRASTCNSNVDCERMEILSGFHVHPSTVLELGGTKNDFIVVPNSDSLILSSVLFLFPRVPLTPLLVDLL
jgi:hypothetical protein